MKLKRLIIQGFKSFKDRTVVHFDDGITGIVGPNGCGKSNIVDALFWVMGEQSAKHLRGNSMADVIFAGSDKYAPAVWAEVSLVLGNDTGKHIHIGNTLSNPSEIQLTRKLYRNGDSEYRINSQPARLKDIQEIFMDTGAGAKSYSIIAQGEINRLVQAKPEERRSIIEDVAGITKFKIRKKESLKKIEQTEANLSRLHDLEQEINKQLKLLEKQSEKAERARELKEKIERHDLIVSSHKEFEYLKEIKELRTSVDEMQSNLTIWASSKSTIELGLEEERIRKEELTEKVDELSSEYNELSKLLAAAEERLSFLKKSREEKERQIETRKKELASEQEEMAGRARKLEAMSQEREQLELLATQDHDTSDLEMQVENLKEELELHKEKYSETASELAQLQKQQTSLDQEQFKNSSKMEEFARTLEDVTKEIDGLESQYSGISSTVNKEREAVKESELHFQELTAKEPELKDRLATLRATLIEREAKVNALSKEEISLESKISSLEEINRAMEGVKAGTSAFLNEKPEANFSLFGTLIESEEQYSACVATALEDFVNALYHGDKAFGDFHSWHKERGPSCDLLVIDGDEFSSTETLERLKLQGLGDVRSLRDVVRFKSGESTSLDAFLSGYFIADNVSSEAATRISSSISFKAIVSLDGKRILKNLGGGKIFSVKSEGSGGVIERNNKIKELTLHFVDVKKEHIEKQDELAAVRAEIASHTEVLESFTNTLIEARSNFSSKKSALEAKLQSFEAGNNRLEILKNRKKEVSSSRIQYIEQEEILTNKLIQIKKDADEKLEIFEEYKGKVEELQSSYSERREELMQKQHDARTVTDRLKSANSQEEDLKAQLDRLHHKCDQITEVITRLENEIETGIQQAEELRAENSEKAGELSDKKESLDFMRDQLADLLVGMQERENEVRKLGTKISQSEKDLVGKEHKKNQLIIDEAPFVRDVFERYQIDLRRTLAIVHGYQEEDFAVLQDLTSMYQITSEEGVREIQNRPYDFVRRYGQDLEESKQKLRRYKNELGSLGEINWQAIEDYDRQKKRHDFLKRQEVELRQGLEHLQAAIKQIDEKSKERFLAAFEEVTIRFEKVFPIIFGGGNARLQITGNIDSDECGVDIIAQPPGKKMQNINLMSGGEKAMTAVSLIFSIFLVKPSPFCLLDEVDAPLDDANVGRFIELLREMSTDSQFILITHNKKTMELNDTLYGVTMQEPGVSKAVSIQLH